MAGRTPAAGGRLPLGKAVGQAWALYLAGFLALAGGVVLLVNPGAGLRLVKWTLGLFLVGWGVMRVVHPAFKAMKAGRGGRIVTITSSSGMLGARQQGSGVRYPVSQAAAGHGASASVETEDPAVAYAGHSRPQPVRYRRGDLP